MLSHPSWAQKVICYQICNVGLCVLICFKKYHTLAKHLNGKTVNALVVRVEKQKAESGKLRKSYIHFINTVHNKYFYNVYPLYNVFIHSLMATNYS